MFIVSPAWQQAYPGAAIGILTMRGVENPAHHPALEERKQALEAELRARFAGYDRSGIKALPIMQAYAAYYRRFKKTYHVRLQLESIVLKGRSLPGGATLVEAMFMAELQNMLLTAGHDLDAVRPPVRIDVASGSERYTRINGREQGLKARDMFIVDAQGILSSVIYGPDRRTQIAPHTRRVLFTVYVPAGIEEEAVYAHLQAIQSNVLLFAPQAETTLLQVYGTTR